MSTKPSTIQIDIPITPAPSPSSSPSRMTARSRTSLTIPSTSDDITRGSKTVDMQTTKNKGPLPPNPPSPEIASLAQLLTDMKKASKGFANVLGSFETGAAKVANIGANVKASEEIERLRKSHQQQLVSHAGDIERVRQELRERMETAVKDRLRPFVLRQVQESVASQVKARVEQQLRQRLSDRLREDAKAHHNHMQDIQVQLHNMEARRVNGMLSKAEQLKPLLRLPSPSAYTPLNARTPAVLASPEDVLPSPKFPRSVEACRSLSDADVKELAIYYGFWEDRAKPYEKVASSVKKKINGPPREEVLNHLLEYIGAPGFHFLRIVPTSSSSSPVGSNQPRVLLLRKTTI